jgi:RND superfamily putative drug exporter
VFARLGSWCHRRRWSVVGAWLAVLVVGGIASGAVGTNFRSEFSLPDVESRRGFEILEAGFGGVGTGEAGSIVVRAEQGVTDPQVEAAVSAFLGQVAAIEGVTVVSPYAPGAEGQISVVGEHAGKIAYAPVELPPGLSVEEAMELGTQIKDLMPTVDGVQIELGGAIFGEFEAPSSEILGLAFAIVILILAFGSVLAMGLPVGVALAGIGVGTVVVGLLSQVLTVPDFATILGIMIGLGVGIDYALFIVTRFRENLHHGHTVQESTAIALDTAGRAVTFAGITVVISLMGMVLMGMSFVTGIAVGAASVVAITVVASLTLLPALLGFAGERVEVTRYRGLIAAGLVAVALVGVGLGITPLVLGLPLAVVVLLASFAVRPLRREVPRRARKPLRETTAYRWSRLVQRHPWASVVLAGGFLLVLAIPVASLRLGFSDEGNFAEDTTTRKAYDLLAEGFGPGFNGPLLVVTEVPPGTAPAALDQVSQVLAGDEGVAFATPAIPNDPANPTAVLWRVIPTSAPQDEATTELVDRLRGTVMPAVQASTGLDPAVTGAVAIQVDFSDYLASRLPWFFAAVLGLSFLLLMAVFRSVLVPLKAVVMNLLSIGAAYGVIVAIFQWGWLSGITGVEPAPIEPFMPMMLFAIVFGLSMDYEVFLLSRIKEEWNRTGDSRMSVADGLAATARVITAAAAIMVFVFGSFLLEADRTIKLAGLGLSVAILLDATVVRMLLVPATMELLGDKNWWLPRWLDRLLPSINVEGDTEAVEEDLAAELEGSAAC